MKIQVETLSPVERKVTIEVDPDRVAKELERAYVGLSRRVKLRGFRPGKAPKDVVKRHFAADVQSDVMNKLISNAYFEAVQEHKISPVEMPEISDVSLSAGAPLSFSATVEVRPAIEIGTYEGIEVNASEITVSDAEIDETLKRIQEMYAQLEVVEGRPAEVAGGSGSRIAAHL